MYALKIHKPQHVNGGGGEDFGLSDFLTNGRKDSLRRRVDKFAVFLQTQAALSSHLYMREVVSAADRAVLVKDPFTGETQEMVMFGSNNYLGLANHPYVREKVARAIAEFGVGLGGPPLLNGYTRLHRELEERLAALKGAEDALLFPTGYSANVGLISCLTQRGDTVLFDAFSHASFRDGLRMSHASHRKFLHNRLDQLERMLEESEADEHDTFVGVEGVYSMDGDLAPLDQIVRLCRRYGATLIVDDAHGTGVMGPSGRGTAEQFGVEGQIDVTMGTFSKAFAVTGGFVAASRAMVDYLRFFARSHMFSAALPPMVAAAVLAGLDVMEEEPDLLDRLRHNVDYVKSGLAEAGIAIDTPSPIIALKVPAHANIHEAARKLHAAGLFVNGIVYPAVAMNDQRFRISLMATHTRDDLDRLIECFAEIYEGWRTPALEAVAK
jgi:glycine C-acetyltransferase